ncbi:MAG: rhodanese-like domain-containing protein [Aeromicrobium sp.]
MSIDERLAEIREHLDRLTPAQASREVEAGAVIIDIRPARQRTTEIPGSLIIERNHLEWRLDPTSGAAVPVADTTSRWIVVCQQGYASSLAAESLRRIGLDATDVIDGIDGWAVAGLPVVAGPSDVESFVELPDERNTA